jgi:hypothetical protein
VAQPVDLLVDRGVLLDVEVLGRETKYSTALLGKNVRNSLHSWAASVLLCAITSVGRWTAAIVAAMVIVLPVPVAPSSVWKRAPSSIPSAREAIAAG